MQNSSMPGIWIFLPVYRDVPAYRKLREKVNASLKNDALANLGPIHFVVIDDSGGQDPAIETLKSEANTHVVHCPFNVGHQRALVLGLRKIVPTIQDQDVIVTMDSDGQDKAEDIPRLLTEVARNPDRISLAYRRKRPETFTFRILYLIFKQIFKTLTGHIVRNGNFAAYRAALAQRFLFHPYFDLCYSSSLISLKIPLSPVECDRGKRLEGSSRMSLLKLVIHGLRMMMPFLDQIAARSLLFFFLVFVLGVLMAVAIVWVRLFTPMAIPGWATYSFLTVVILTVGAMSNFIIFFTLFFQSQLDLLSVLERNDPSRTPSL